MWLHGAWSAVAMRRWSVVDLPLREVPVMVSRIARPRRRYFFASGCPQKIYYFSRYHGGATRALPEGVEGALQPVPVCRLRPGRGRHYGGVGGDRGGQGGVAFGAARWLSTLRCGPADGAVLPWSAPWFVD